ncbi:MAG: class I SAM-dependent methyltransferase [Parvularculaceae bacterium]
MTSLRSTIDECLNAPTRIDFWAQLLVKQGAASAAEVGVWKGDFAAEILKRCPGIEQYFMIDPWRRLDAWNKPANVEDDAFAAIYAEAMSKTDFAKDRISVLRGKTTEVIDAIPDNSLDFVYIDGDHTLKGISIDLIRSYAKVKPGGVVGGDDLARNMWHHPAQFEPTLVFPFAVYFAEAVGAPIYALPNSQFLIQKQTGDGFSFEDLVGIYDDFGLRNQLPKRPGLMKRVKAATPAPIKRIAKFLLGKS